MRRPLALGALVGSVLFVTVPSPSHAQTRMRFEGLGDFELYRRLVDGQERPRVTVGGSVAVTGDDARARDAGGAGLAGITWAARVGEGMIGVDSRLSAALAGEGDVALVTEGTHRGFARVGNYHLDVAFDHSAAGRSFAHTVDVASEPYWDVALGLGSDLVVRPLDKNYVVAPLTARVRHVGYQVTRVGPVQGFNELELASGIGVRFQGEKAIGSVEMLGVSFKAAAFEASADSHYAAPRTRELDVRLINYDDVFFHDGAFAASLYLRLGYGQMWDETTGDDGGSPIFRFGMQAEDKTGGLGLLYGVEPGHDDEGRLMSVMRVELLARGRRERLGAWDLRLTWACGTPTGRDVCGDGAKSRAGVELEAYLEPLRDIQVGGTYTADYGPWRAETQWRNDALAFVRWAH